MKILLILATCATALAATAELKPSGARNDQAMQVTLKTGSAFITVRDLHVDATYGSGSIGRGELMILFDSASGFFVWEYRDITRYHGPPMPDNLKDALLYVDANAILFFRSSYPPGALFIEESSERAGNIEDAERKALQAAALRLDEMPQTGVLGGRMREVRLTIPLDLYVPKFAVHAMPLKLLSVTRKDDKWEVLVEALWKEKLTINDKVDFVGAEEVK